MWRARYDAGYILLHISHSDLLSGAVDGVVLVGLCTPVALPSSAGDFGCSCCPMSGVVALPSFARDVVGLYTPVALPSSAGDVVGRSREQPRFNVG